MICRSRRSQKNKQKKENPNSDYFSFFLLSFFSPSFFSSFSFLNFPYRYVYILLYSYYSYISLSEMKKGQRATNDSITIGWIVQNNVRSLEYLVACSSFLILELGIDYKYEYRTYIIQLLFIVPAVRYKFNIGTFFSYYSLPPLPSWRF